MKSKTNMKKLCNKNSLFYCWICSGFILLVMMILIVISIAEKHVIIISDKLNPFVLGSLSNRDNMNHNIEILTKIYADVIRVENKVVIINDIHNPFELG